MDEAREWELAQALANLMDGNRRHDASTITLFPDLADELDALAEIDRAIESDAALPDRLSGHKVLGGSCWRRMKRWDVRWRSRR